MMRIFLFFFLVISQGGCVVDGVYFPRDMGYDRSENILIDVEYPEPSALLPHKIIYTTSNGERLSYPVTGLDFVSPRILGASGVAAGGGVVIAVVVGSRNDLGEFEYVGLRLGTNEEVFRQRAIQVIYNPIGQTFMFLSSGRITCRAGDSVIYEDEVDRGLSYSSFFVDGGNLRVSRAEGVDEGVEIVVENIDISLGERVGINRYKYTGATEYRFWDTFISYIVGNYGILYNTPPRFGEGMGWYFMSAGSDEVSKIEMAGGTSFIGADDEVLFFRRGGNVVQYDILNDVASSEEVCGAVEGAGWCEISLGSNRQLHVKRNSVLADYKVISLMSGRGE